MDWICLWRGGECGLSSQLRDIKWAAHLVWCFEMTFSFGFVSLFFFPSPCVSFLVLFCSPLLPCHFSAPLLLSSLSSCPLHISSSPSPSFLLPSHLSFVFFFSCLFPSIHLFLLVSFHPSFLFSTLLSFLCLLPTLPAGQYSSLWRQWWFWSSVLTGLAGTTWIEASCPATRSPEPSWPPSFWSSTFSLSCR